MATRKRVGRKAGRRILAIWHRAHEAGRIERAAGAKTVRSHRAARGAYKRARTRAEHRMLESARARGLAGLTAHASALGA